MTYKEFVEKYGRDPMPCPDNGDEQMDNDEQMAWEDLCFGAFWDTFNELCETEVDRERPS